MIVGTAGHIDHGKTALIKALTGAEGDRLAAEKARGITIELGFAYADLGSGAITGFVDVPGHERFVHTMLAGAGGIDLALLVIAANDGIMPQTREHLAILDLLGIRQGVVALTKCDLVGTAQIAARQAEIAQLLAPTGQADAPIIPVSSLTGAGIETLCLKLMQAEAASAARSVAGRFRLVIDRAFVLSGAGVVVTGPVISGQVSVGDHICLSPSGIKARIRAIHAQNHKADTGSAGQRCALNLTGEHVSRDVITRGEVALDPLLFAPTDRFDATVFVLAAEPRPLAGWHPARLHIGAAEVGARLVPLGPALAGGQSGLMQLVLDQPVAAFVGDRFILRDVSARRTIGGGTVLDPHAPARKRARPERLAFLAAAAIPDPVAALQAFCASPAGLVDLASFARDRALSQSQIEAAFAASGLVEIAGQGMSADTLTRLGIEMSEALAQFHAENPDLQGLSREAMRLKLTPRLPKDCFTSFIRAQASAGQIVLDGAFLRLADHLPRLSAQDEAIWARIVPELGGEARFRPPRVRDFARDLNADEGDLRRIFRMAARQGRVDQIAHDHFFLRSTTEEMAMILRRLAQQSDDGWISAPAFRDQLNNGRKVAIEILDFFDRHGLTLRRGDLRRTNPHRSDLFSRDPP